MALKSLKIELPAARKAMGPGG